MASSSLPPLPAGYALDQPTQGAGTPPLPAGYTLDQPAKHDWLDSATDFARSLWSKVNPVSGVQGAAELAAHPLNSYVADAGQRQKIMDNAEADFKKGDYASGIARSLHSIVPFLGPQMESAGEKIASGQVAQGVGESVGLGLNLATPELTRTAVGAIGELPDVADLRTRAATALTTEKGALKPVAKTAAKVGGAVVGGGFGSLVGHPGYGAIAGELAGPEMLKTVIGPRPPLSAEDVFNQRVAKGVENAKVREAVKEAVAAQTTPAINGPEDPNWKPDDGVLHVPEPNPLAPGEKPGSMYSVPRNQLVPAAMSGKPGALDVLRDLNQKAIVIPRGTGYPGPRPNLPLPSSIHEFPEPGSYEEPELEPALRNFSTRWDVEDLVPRG